MRDDLIPPKIPGFKLSGADSSVPPVFSPLAFLSFFMPGCQRGSPLLVVSRQGNVQHNRNYPPGASAYFLGRFSPRIFHFSFVQPFLGGEWEPRCEGKGAYRLRSFQMFLSQGRSPGCFIFRLILPSSACHRLKKANFMLILR